MSDVPTTEPTAITAGDTIKWTISLGDYLASAGWVLSYVLHLRSSVAATPITVDASASGDDHAVIIAATTSAAYPAGDYEWYSYVTKDAERYSIASGSITIKPDPSTVTAGTDLRSHARIVLDAIEATLEGTATTDQEKIMVDGDTLERRSIADLLAMRDRYATEVARESAAESIAKGLATGRRVLTRF